MKCLLFDGGEDKSYSGNGGVSYVNAFRHQRLINEGSKYGVFTQTDTLEKVGMEI